MPLKIIHLSASDKGGAFSMADKLVQMQNANGLIAKHAVFTGELANIKITGIKFIDTVYKFGLHAVEKFIFLFYEKSKNNRFKFSLGYPGIPISLLKKITKNYDIVHIHWINKGFVNIKDLEKLNKPIVWTAHDIWIATGGCHLSMACTNYRNKCGDCFYLKNSSPNDLSSLLFKNKQQAVFKLNIAFVSPSKWMQENLKHSAITESKPNYKIANGIDIKVFKNLSFMRNELFTVGFVAANLNDENKALNRLAEAIAWLSVKYSDLRIKLILIGTQKFEFAFDFKCELSIVPFVKNANDMVSYYNQMDLLAVTSTIETLPTTILEAGCCGTPSVAFNVGGISDIVSNENGALVNAFEVESYAATIYTIYKNPFERNQVSNYMSEKFGLLKSHENYLEIYNSLIVNY